jgi:predicted GIY-YIG superfamily endonuclease
MACSCSLLRDGPTRVYRRRDGESIGRAVDIPAKPDVSSPEERRSRTMKPRYRSMLRKMEVREGKNPALPLAATWSLYILKCLDGSFYTGVTTDIDRRFREHEAGRASRFTRTRRPVVLVYQETCGSRSVALSRECAVKSMGRQGKEDLVAGGSAAVRPKKPKRRKPGNGLSPG